MMKQSLIALAATVSLAAGMVAAHAATTTYPDVSGNWAQTNINNLVNLQIMSGYNDGQFHPSAWVTRAEFLNMTAKTLGLPPNQITQIPSLRDVSQNAYSFSAIDNQAWISTYPQGVFRPENPIRRVEVLSALAGSLNKPLVSPAEAEQILSRYSDAALVPANARQQVATAIRYNLFANDPAAATMIQPLEPATRAEVAAMLDRMYQNRDIAIVQNGAIVARTEPTTTTTTTMTVTPPATETTPLPVDYSSKNRSVAIREAGEPNPKEGYTMTNPDGDFVKGIPATPYRNSADTIPVFRNPGIHPITGIQPMKTANLPLNTVFTGTVAKAIYSEYNHPGDPVMLILDHSLIGADGKVIAPAGSRVLGRVDSVVPNNTTRDIAQMGLVFTEILTPTGERVAINATVASTNGLIRADVPQGVVFNPDSSTAALNREIYASEGGLYGSKAGKMDVLYTPMVTLGDKRPLQGIDPRVTPKVVIGVGDKLQLRACCTTCPPAGTGTPTQ
ncbi:MAG TPA: S-layer homology domain-containing protein [Coleofasciculaceae cyanobacterium]